MWKKKALIIDGTGFLGYANVEELIKGGWEVSFAQFILQAIHETIEWMEMEQM